ncbi:hypothetical protein JYL57_001481 [Salmonella enterica subsp. enterica serovar Typhimurium]|uniref:hypothetical protein n=1 Tax=Salmonella enterica TaxID=28901 RepID=UPI00193E6486|nr:hypothetical protein [Salmonella enterica]EDY1994241.1 hypothetical protein [Salmonella enterica subsp. diarizonae]EEN5590427.1 hypothetical protein [Salmonella enterica subsp. enterica serovar Mountpleasant]EHD9479272.1 hypothetical protein [Salmonella enterica subsp. enterica serovar Typhimurium]
MKLTVGDIRFSASCPVNIFATVDVESGKSLSPICSISVTVPMVEGKVLEQYKDDLLEAARERITKMYKEIVCEHGKEHSITRDDQQDLVDAEENRMFKVEYGKITINAAQVELINQSPKDSLEGRVAALEEFATGITNRFNLYTIK